MPLTVDLSETVCANGRVFHRDLRPDYADANYARIVRNVVTQIKARRPHVPVINMVTHNDNDYTDPGDPVRRHFETVLAEIDTACAEAGLQPVGATIETVCDQVPAVAEPTEYVGVLHNPKRSGG